MHILNYRLYVCKQVIFPDPDGRDDGLFGVDDIKDDDDDGVEDGVEDDDDVSADLRRFLAYALAARVSHRCSCCLPHRVVRPLMYVESRTHSRRLSARTRHGACGARSGTLSLSRACWHPRGCMNARIASLIG